MKVKDLIIKLKVYPPEAQVLVYGYEDGFDSIKINKEYPIVKNSNAADYKGEYEKVENDSKGAVSAVVILGNRR